MSRVLIVVARRYNGHELGAALRIFTQRGHKFGVASAAHVIEDEVTGAKLTVKHLIGEVNPNHDALMFVSGNMQDTEYHWTHPITLEYVDKFEAEGKPISAICCSVPSIRFAASGKKVSFFPLVRSRQLLEDAGAICTPVTLTVDQNLVTAEHQMASEMWVEEVCNMLEGKPPQYSFKESGFVPEGLRPRKLPPAVARIQAQLARSREADSETA